MYRAIVLSVLLFAVCCLVASIASGSLMLAGVGTVSVILAVFFSALHAETHE